MRHRSCLEDRNREVTDSNNTLDKYLLSLTFTNYLLNLRILHKLEGQGGGFRQICKYLQLSELAAS